MAHVIIVYSSLSNLSRVPVGGVRVRLPDGFKNQLR